MARRIESTVFGSMKDVSVLAGKLSRLSVGKPEVEGELVFASPEDTIGGVIARMIEKDLQEIPVIQKKNVSGVFSLREVVRRKKVPPAAKVRTLQLPTPDLHPWSNIFDLAAAIINTGFRQLPVIEEGRLAGIADRTLLVRLVSDVKEFGEVSVADAMTPEVITLMENDYLDSAFEIIRRTGVRAVPIVDEKGRMVSLLSIGDLLKIGMRNSGSESPGEIIGRTYPVEITVGSIASREFVSLSAEDRMRRAISLMLDPDIAALPVLEEGRPVGILTKYDIAQMVLSLQIRETVYVQVTGMQDESILEDMYEVIGKSLKKIDRILRPVAFYLHVHTYNSEFGKIKYSMSGKLQTTEKLFVAKAFDWDPNRTIMELMVKLENMVKEMKSMRTESRRAKKSERKEGI